MTLSLLKLENFRGFERQTVSLAPRTVVIGANGTGKSTLIEALRLLSVGKSFRTSRLDELIRFEAPFFRLAADRELGEKSQTVEFFYGQAFPDSPKERQLSVNSQNRDWLSFVGQFPSVLFVPSDIDLIYGSPQLRRRYLDSILWQVSPQFRADYLDFSRVLRERSALLFMLKIHRANRDELQPWNELIEKLSQAIQSQRQKYVTYLSAGLASRKVGGAAVMVVYQPNDVRLAAVEAQEIQSAQNIYGAHRDELEILLGGRSARRFASRGQARTIIVMLKAVEGRFLAEQTEQAPLLLLDDMFSELDEENSRILFDDLPAAYQVILTTISPQALTKDWSAVKL